MRIILRGLLIDVTLVVFFYVLQLSALKSDGRKGALIEGIAYTLFAFVAQYIMVKSDTRKEKANQGFSTGWWFVVIIGAITIMIQLLSYLYNIY